MTTDTIAQAAERYAFGLAGLLLEHGVTGIEELPPGAQTELAALRDSLRSEIRAVTGEGVEDPSA